MRNEPKPLDEFSARRAYRLKAELESRQGENVTMTYVKRNGQESSSTGQIRFFSGREGMDTMSVTLHTADKGDRTINLCRVIKAWPSN